MDERIKDLWAEYAPRIEEAKSRDGRAAHALFLRWQEETIGVLPAVLLDMERWILLHEADALVTGQTPTMETTLRFLWIVSPRFSPLPRRARWFFWRHRNIDLPTVLEDIHAYLRRQLGEVGGGNEDEANASPKEWVSGIVDLVAAEYGWSIESILSLPLQVLFILMRRIRARTSGNDIAFNPEGDRLQAEFMSKANAIGGAK